MAIEIKIIKSGVANGVSWTLINKNGERFLEKAFVSFVKPQKDGSTIQLTEEEDKKINWTY